MLPEPLTRGAVIFYAERTFIIWTHRPDGIALGLSVRPQTGPRHRSHVPISQNDCEPLGLRRFASIVATGEPLIAIPTQSLVLGRAPASLLAQIAETIRRADFADRFERQMTPPLTMTAEALA
jgi:hypothetical protein